MVNRLYRVLHVFSGYGGGISSLVRNLIENRDKDFIFDVMTFSYNGGEAFIEIVAKNGGCCLTMPRPKIDGFKRFITFIDNAFKDGKYDAVHCHISGYAALIFYTLARKSGIPKFFVHAHSTIYDSRINRLSFMNSLNKIINYKIATAYFTCSDLAAEYMFGNKYTKKKETILIPNGISENKFEVLLNSDDKKAYNDAFRVKSDSTLILMHVGRFTYAKNHDFIIEIAKELQHKNVDYRLIMVGDGELFNAFSDKIKEEGLISNVVLAGRRTDIPLLMQYATKVILPSYREGLPTVAIESQACGTPILVSDTVTRQCDMDIGLAVFLPISNCNVWIDEILKDVGHLSPTACLKQIKEKHFTASTASSLYCGYLRNVLKR